MHSLVPIKPIIWAKADRSLCARKKGYRPLKMHSKITPADQMSTAVVCQGHFRRTSGARNPGVPARGAAWLLL